MELEGRGGYKFSLAFKGPDPCTLPPIQAARKAFVKLTKQKHTQCPHCVASRPPGGHKRPI